MTNITSLPTKVAVNDQSALLSNNVSNMASTKIVKADAILVSLPFASPGLVPWNMDGDKVPEKRFDVLLVRLETNTGLVGWGEAFSRNRDRALRDMIQTKVLSLVVGRNPYEIGKIKNDIERQLHNFGRSGPLQYGVGAVDLALWDLMGKSSGLPVAELLGGRYANELDVYASLPRVGDVDAMRDVIEEVVTRGYKHIKLHDIDPKVIRAAFAAAPKDATMMLDLNCPWSVTVAEEMARDMSDLGAYWWEEPVWPPENYRGLARLRKEGYRTAAGENAGTYYDFVAMVDAGAIDVAQPDVSKVGGLTDTRAIAQLCDANGLQIVPHAAIFGPGLLATVHFNASRYDTPFVERLYFDFEAELFGDALVPVNGRVAVPTNPGLGHDPNEEVIAEYRLD